MIALARLFIIGFLVLTVVYVCLSLYSRAVRREKLETWYEEEGRPGDLDRYVADGLKEYDRSLRRKLILGVYVVPLTLMCTIIYLTNFH
jgi:hypothetical protein